MAQPKDSRPKDHSQPKAKPKPSLAPPPPPDDPKLVEILEKGLSIKKAAKKKRMGNLKK